MTRLIWLLGPSTLSEVPNPLPVSNWNPPDRNPPLDDVQRIRSRDSASAGFKHQAVGFSPRFCNAVKPERNVVGRSADAPILVVPVVFKIPYCCGADPVPLMTCCSTASI